MRNLGTLQRRTLVRPAFGLLFSLLTVLATPQLLWAQRDPYRTVSVGPSRLVATAQGKRLRPTLAVADRVVVQLAPGARLESAERAGSRVRGRVARHVGGGMYTIDLPAGTDVVSAAAALRQQPGVLTAGPDLIMYPTLIPDDERYSYQYHLPQIKAPLAWDITTGSPAVTVAIIDSGVYTSHPDLASQIWINTDEVEGNKRDDDHNGYVDDFRGWDFYADNNNPNPSPDGEDENQDGEADEQANHGTLVAGTAAARGNDGYGVAGVAWGARIMALQVFPDDGGTAVSNVVEAINYAVANGADIINLSIGGGYTDLFTTPIAAAFNAGVVVVAAAGNSGDELTDSKSTWESPVCNDGANVWTENHILGVGAVDRNDRRASYSNFDGSSASFVEIMAPGDAIYGTAAYFPGVNFKTYFQTNSGTSFSAPVITGLVALLLTQYPNATPTEIIDLVARSGDNIDSLNPGFIGKLGGGRINCARALGVNEPPAPARDLAAADTTGDDGGSISVTWRPSPDDGGGSGKVQSYTLLRSTDGAKAFTALATLPKGTEAYSDTSVTDGTDYYYMLRTSDGTLTSDTEPVGPAQSRNDAPPPPLAEVVAFDRPNDTGKAIIVRWGSYTPPADFQRYSVYRSTLDFASTAALTPLATLTSSGTVSYLDTTAVDGVDYYYAVGVRDTAGNEVRALRAFGPVQSFSNDSITFPAGLHFLGSPTIPDDSDPATLFGLEAGSFPYARWVPQSAAYVYDPGQRPLQELLQMDLGRGFWIKLASPVTISPDGRSAPAGDFDIELTPGWHQLANPFFASINFGEATVTYQGAAMDLISASGAGIMASFAWTYDSAGETYQLAYPHTGATPTLIPPWRGFWVLVHKSCTLTLTRPFSSSGAVSLSTARVSTQRAATAQLDAEWTIPLRATSASGGDTACLVGLASRALALDKPPAATAAPVLTMGRPNAAQAGRYAVSLAQSGASDIIWKMQVTNLQAGQPVRVSAPDLSALPANRQVLLEDLTTGQLVYLRTATGYTFTPREGETSRQLRLTVSSQSSSALRLQGLTAQAARAGGAQLFFTLSAPAECTVSVMNMAGRSVRTLEEGKLRPTGNNVVLWDGRNQLGTKAPAGLYLLQVTARTQTGQSVRAISSLKL